MNPFIIDPNGKLIVFEPWRLHIDYFNKNLLKSVSSNQMVSFYKALNYDVPKDDVIFDSFKDFLLKLESDENHHFFYCGVTAMGFICGTTNANFMSIRMSSFDDVLDSQVETILKMLIDRHIKSIMVDFINIWGSYKHKEFTVNEFVEEL